MLLFTDAGAIIDDPYQVFYGRPDAVSMEEGGQTSTLEIAVESRLLELQRARNRRYTHEDQIREHPLDKGFEYVEQIQELNLSWGSTQPIPQGLVRRG